jgi:hypothetical protein
MLNSPTAKQWIFGYSDKKEFITWQKEIYTKVLWQLFYSWHFVLVYSL